MKEFFKFMFASFLGTLLTLLVIGLIFIGMIAGIVSMSQDKEVEVKSNSVLHISWKTPILDRGSDNPFENFDFNSMESNKPVGLNDILENLEKASKDPNIDGIFLDMETVPAGMAALEEIRDKMMAFKESGKFIISYANNYDQKGYYLASLADEIYLNPEGMILFKGLHAQLMFFKGLLEKIDVDMQILRGPDNKFKSAVEPLMLEKMSEANREQFETLLNSAWGQMLMDISDSRNISIGDLNKIADKLELTSADNALEYNFIDGIMYRDELIDMLKEKTGREDDDKVRSISFGKYTKAKDRKERKMTKNKVAVIFAEGSIVQGKGGQGEIGSASLAATIRKVRKDDNVKAIVFRVNSPGGDAQASEEIRREVELAGANIPFIVSMGNVAASGGYWISTSADYIFAQPTTITGSIGVFGIIPNFKKLFNDKLGITFDEVMTNENSDFIDVMKPMSEFQKAKLNEQIVEIYEDFTELVATTRNLDVAYVNEVGRGRVWLGTDALEKKLVDQMGGLEDAIAYAIEQAELGEEFRISEYPKQKDFFEQLAKEIMGDVKTRIIGNELGDFKSYYDQYQSIRNMEGVQARLPFVYTIN
jgi:protease-4